MDEITDKSTTSAPVAVHAAPSTVDVHPVEFPQMHAASQGGRTAPLARFYDVTVTVSVELGRATIPIGDLLQLGEGAVIELDRAIGEPVDLVAQGVTLARGEVVVVDDCYAIRIRDVSPPAAEHRTAS